LLAVLRRCRSPLLRLSKDYLPVCFVSACLETADDVANVSLHLLLNKEDTMQMVGHELEGDGGNLRVMDSDGKPLVLHPLS
jgi:hypothetical protein